MNLNNMSEKEIIELITKITVELLQSMGQSSTSQSATLTPACVCTGDNLTDCTSCGYCVVLRPDVDKIVTAGADRISTRPGIQDVAGDLAKYIDHTLLKPDTTDEALRKLCEEALKHRFASVCVNSANVKFCADRLKGSQVKIAAVVGFPLGASTTRVKMEETKDAVRDGASEIDMVMNIGAMKSGDYRTVYRDIEGVVTAAGCPVKVILETALLTENEKVIACALAKAAGAHFVKTSTGFGPKGATVADIELMRTVVGPTMGVKASGGIRDEQTVRKMLEAGATRIGASASVAIVEGKTGTSAY